MGFRVCRRQLISRSRSAPDCSVNCVFLLWTRVAGDEKRLGGEKRKHKRQISGILQRIRSWELEPALFKWWNGSPKGPRLRSTQLVTKRSSPSRRNDKYTRLHTIIKFLHYVVSSSALQIKSFCWTWAPSWCGNLNVTESWERRGPENSEVVTRHQSYFCL